jgi:ribonuclease HI
VNDVQLQQLHERVQELASQVEQFEIEHVSREQNQVADGLVSDALEDR